MTRGPFYNFARDFMRSGNASSGLAGLGDGDQVIGSIFVPVQQQQNAGGSMMDFPASMIASPVANVESWSGGYRMAAGGIPIV
ncbi:MAG: hypothetical protein ACREJD_05845 [Phycisphaerales bacterium]